MPHCVALSNLGPTIFAPSAAIGVFVLRNCATVEKNDNLERSCKAPGRFVCASAPQSPLNALLNPSSVIRLLKISD